MELIFNSIQCFVINSENVRGACRGLRGPGPVFSTTKKKFFNLNLTFVH